MLHRLRYKFHQTDGFTLIELLVVIAMMGTIAAIAAPSWQGFLNRQRMNAARGDLMSILKNAQDEAQARQQSKRVTFSSDTSAPMSVTVLNDSDTTGGITTVLGSGEVSSKFSLTAPAPIVFDSDGRVNIPTPYVTPYVIKITNDDSPPPQAGESPTQSCVIVTTLLGGLKAANNDLCENP